MQKGRPLTQAETLEDIVNTYAQKTATFDPHPHLPSGTCTPTPHATARTRTHSPPPPFPSAGPQVSIHPCRHANVMKKIASVMRDAGREVRPEHYHLIFLKFMASVLPTIHYDNTAGLEFGEE